MTIADRPSTPIDSNPHPLTMRAAVFLLLAVPALAGFDWGAVTSQTAKQQGDVS